MHARFARHPVVLLAIAATYFALGQSGFAVGGFTGGATAVWPPSGFGLAVLILLGRQAWPGVFAGAFLALFVPTLHPISSVVVAIGYTLQALVGAVMVDRWARGEKAFQHQDTIFRFVAIAAFVSAPIGATFEVLGTAPLSVIVWDDFVYLWMTSWLAGLAGILVIAPFTLLWITTPLTVPRLAKGLEAVVILIVLAVLGLVVFAGQFPSDVQDYPLEFLCMPVLLWAAFRQGRRMVVTAMAVLSALAVWGTMRGVGPFVRDSQNEALVLVQAYVSVMTTMGMVLAAVVAEHRRAEHQLRELATTDPLTGLANYRRLLGVLKTEIARSTRTGRTFAVLFLDMNGLKVVNDRYGHLAGSRALCRIADTLRRSCRATDVPARFGGDEFAVVLPETGEEGGHVLLARVAEALAALPDKPTVSVSGGVAVFPRDGASPTLLLRAADRLLYQAKTQAGLRRSAADEHPLVRRTGTLS
jgi:diguanylate cyclase (GGDEF)-like protein